MRMTWGTNTIDFFYDASGLPYAMKYNRVKLNITIFMLIKRPDSLPSFEKFL